MHIIYVVLSSDVSGVFPSHILFVGTQELGRVTFNLRVTEPGVVRTVLEVSDKPRKYNQQDTDSLYSNTFMLPE